MTSARALMTRLRDLGEAHVLSAAGNAVACQASVLIAGGEDAPAWSGQLWPYRPLALAHGRYTLRVRGEDLGALTVQAIRMEPDREVAEFVGVGAPSQRLRELASRGGMPGRVRDQRFPRVGAEVESTALAALVARLASVLGRLFTAPGRSVPRRRP